MHLSSNRGIINLIGGRSRSIRSVMTGASLEPRTIDKPDWSNKHAISTHISRFCLSKGGGGISNDSSAKDPSDKPAPRGVKTSLPRQLAGPKCWPRPDTLALATKLTTDLSAYFTWYTIRGYSVGFTRLNTA